MDSQKNVEEYALELVRAQSFRDELSVIRDRGLDKEASIAAELLSTVANMGPEAIAALTATAAAAKAYAYTHSALWATNAFQRYGSNFKLIRKMHAGLGGIAYRAGREGMPLGKVIKIPGILTGNIKNPIKMVKTESTYAGHIAGTFLTPDLVKGLKWAHKSGAASRYIPKAIAADKIAKLITSNEFIKKRMPASVL